MIDLRNYKNWDKVNGTLSVTLNPKIIGEESQLYVVLNGSMGNFCLDYTNDDFNVDISQDRAWSSDTGYYVKITTDDKVIVTRWWDDYIETLPISTVQQKPGKFYEALLKSNTRQSDNIISFAKATFIKLRNCVSQADNGKVSLRTFMYLLAALEEGVDLPSEIDRGKWKLEPLQTDWIKSYDWDWLYNAFKSGSSDNKPDIKLVLRHASNRLFQEAHREATKKDFQLALFGGVNRKYDKGITDGAFYTPTPLVRTVVQEALWTLDKAQTIAERKTIRILDPACGSSEFLREALRQLKMLNYTGTVSITGWDISDIACEMSNFVLHYENNTEWNGLVEINIDKKDSLFDDWGTASFDLVLMNPPFQAFENLGDRKTIVLDQLGNLKTRQPDLASVFWKKAAEITSENGALGLVMPHSLIGGETYKNLRTYIKEEVGMDFSLIARLGSAGLFEKAMIIPCVLVGLKKSKSNVHTILWTDQQQQSVYTALRQLRIYRHNNIPTPLIKPEYSIYEDETLTNETLGTWKVNSYQMFQLSDRLRRFTRVGELFNVKRGADSGNNAAFILKKEEWSKLPGTERSHFRPCIMSDSIKNGQLNDHFYMFYPYGDYQIHSAEELAEKLSTFYELKLKKAVIDKLKTRRGRNEKWWELNEHRPWQIEPRPKLVSAYFGRAGYFAFDRTGDYLVAQSFAWLPKTKELNKPNFLLAYLALLHAPLVNKLLEMVCNVLEGGYYDLSKHYVDNMPLPDLSNADVSILKELIDFGKNIYAGKEINNEVLNQIVANAYGLNIEHFQTF